VTRSARAPRAIASAAAIWKVVASEIKPHECRLNDFLAVMFTGENEADVFAKELG
jgi:hypothetical protein